MSRFKLITRHAESRTVYVVVDTEAPSNEQPAVVAIVPSVIGDSATFTAHGKEWICKRSNANTWFLREHKAGYNRGRFGNRVEIADDIDHVLTTGVLPRCETSFA